MSQAGCVLWNQMDLLLMHGKKDKTVRIPAAPRCWLVVLFSSRSYQGDERASVTAPSLPLRYGNQVILNLGLWQRPGGGGRMGKTILKPLHSRGPLTFSNRALLPELGLLFGDHTDLQLSGPEVHIQDRRQARDRQLEENKNRNHKKMFRTED